MASVSSLMLVVCTGVVVDIANLQKSHSQLQTLSDSIGLAAAVYMRDNETPPLSREQGFAAGQSYQISEVSYGKSMPNVTGTFTIEYNDTLAQAEVTFNGQFHTAFMNAFQKPDIEMSLTSTVKYLAVERPAVSVTMIVDNSGSMAWDDKPIVAGSYSRPAGAKTRIQGLRDTALAFSEELAENFDVTESGANSGTKYLRTALIPYSTDVIDADKVEPQWGALSASDLNALDADGGTDSRAPLSLAHNWMQSEDAIHDAENGEEDPKKYAIFMTDGANNDEYVCDWQNYNGTTLWRKHNGYKFEYIYAWNQPGNGWVEGYAYNCTIENKSNADSLEICADIKQDGVEIFTIGYALEPGEYYSDQPNSNATTTIAESTTDSAYDFLSGCASSPEHFIKAEDTEALSIAFEKINKKISEDAIRVAR